MTVEKLIQVHFLPLAVLAPQRLHLLYHGGVCNTVAITHFQSDIAVMGGIEGIGHRQGEVQLMLLETVTGFQTPAYIAIVGKWVVAAKVKTVIKTLSVGIAHVQGVEKRTYTVTASAVSSEMSSLPVYQSVAYLFPNHIFPNVRCDSGVRRLGLAQ